MGKKYNELEERTKRLEREILFLGESRFEVCSGCGCVVEKHHCHSEPHTYLRQDNKWRLEVKFYCGRCVPGKKTE